MGFPFPNIKIRVYPKTFLKDVHIGMFFSEVPLNDELQRRAGEFFDKEFGLQNIKMEEMPKAVSVFSDDRGISFAFGVSRADLRIKRECYRSFTDIEPLLLKLYSYINVLGLRDITKLVFSKYNELGYEAKEGLPVSEVMTDVFSANLLKHMTKRDVATQKNLSRWEKVVCAEGQDDFNSLFTIEFGFRKLPALKGRSSLTLKTLIESRSGFIPLDDFQKMMSYYNQILDNAFHWCVTDRVLAAMKEG